MVNYSKSSPLCTFQELALHLFPQVKWQNSWYVPVTYVPKGWWDRTLEIVDNEIVCTKMSKNVICLLQFKKQCTALLWAECFFVLVFQAFIGYTKPSSLISIRPTERPTDFFLNHSISFLLDWISETVTTNRNFCTNVWGFKGASCDTILAADSLVDQAWNKAQHQVPGA